MPSKLGGRASCPPSWEGGHLALQAGNEGILPSPRAGSPPSRVLGGRTSCPPRAGSPLSQGSGSPPSQGLFLEAGAEMWGHDGAGGFGAAEKAVAAVADEVVAHVAAFGRGRRSLPAPASSHRSAQHLQYPDRGIGLHQQAVVAHQHNAVRETCPLQWRQF